MPRISDHFSAHGVATSIFSKERFFDIEISSNASINNSSAAFLIDKFFLILFPKRGCRRRFFPFSLASIYLDAPSFSFGCNRRRKIFRVASVFICARRIFGYAESVVSVCFRRQFENCIARLTDLLPFCASIKQSVLHSINFNGASRIIEFERYFYVRLNPFFDLNNFFVCHKSVCRNFQIVFSARN